jgi:hypothetical protein
MRRFLHILAAPGFSKVGLIGGKLVIESLTPEMGIDVLMH